MFFRKKSLTAATDHQVHQIVRAKSPAAYWIFRITAFFGRAGAAVAFALIVLYQILSMTVLRELQPGSPEQKMWVEQMSTYIFGTMCFAVVCDILSDGFYKQLQPILNSIRLSISTDNP